MVEKAEEPKRIYLVNTYKHGTYSIVASSIWVDGGMVKFSTGGNPYPANNIVAIFPVNSVSAVIVQDGFSVKPVKKEEWEGDFHI